MVVGIGLSWITLVWGNRFKLITLVWGNRNKLDFLGCGNWFKLITQACGNRFKVEFPWLWQKVYIVLHLGVAMVFK